VGTIANSRQLKPSKRSGENEERRGRHKDYATEKQKTGKETDRSPEKK